MLNTVEGSGEEKAAKNKHCVKGGKTFQKYSDEVCKPQSEDM